MKVFLASVALASSFAHHGCVRTYTVAMASRAIHVEYAGTRNVTRRDLANVARFVRCQRNPHAGPYLAWLQRHQRALWQQRRTPPMNYAVASWYDDTGETASGWHSYYGVANLSLGFGTRVTFYYGGRRVTAVVDDRGPYVGGRDFDLNQNVAAALGFDGVATVGYTIG